MKTIKYLLISLAIAFAIAGCAGGSGGANLDAYDKGQMHEITS